MIRDTQRASRSVPIPLTTAPASLFMVDQKC
jgi:hypothetical protein